jgi:glucuronosyltransferase
MKLPACFVLATWLIAGINGSKILFFTNTISKSHVLVIQLFLDELTERGHEVTSITPYPDVCRHNEKIRHVTVQQDENLLGLLKKMMVAGRARQMLYFGQMLNYFAESSLSMVQNDKVLEAIDEKYDLMILSYMFSDIPLILAHKIKCPVVVFWPRGTMDMLDDFTGNISPVASVPHEGVFKTMTFFNRIGNFLIAAIGSISGFYMKICDNRKYRYVRHQILCLKIIRK